MCLPMPTTANTKNNMDEIKVKLQEQLSELRYSVNALNKQIEWAELTESYPTASEVFRAIEEM